LPFPSPYPSNGRRWFGFSPLSWQQGVGCSPSMIGADWTVPLVVLLINEQMSHLRYFIFYSSSWFLEVAPRLIGNLCRPCLTSRYLGASWIFCQVFS
jgi:hypothetical protein